MAESNDLDRLKAAYQAWHDTRGENNQPWLELMSDNVAVHSIDESAADLDFAKDRFSRQEMIDYFNRLHDAWTMIHWTPQHFVSQGERIAMFGRCAWTNKKTGKDVEIDVAHLWRFEGGQIVELTEVFDSARAAAAAA